MRTKLSGPEKKELSYNKDHRTYIRHPHLFRRQWHNKKAAAEREIRRLMNADVKRIEKDVVNLSVEDMDGLYEKKYRRRTVKKQYTVSLQNWVTEHKEFRATKTARRFFNKPYSTRMHRESFGRFLESLVTGKIDNKSELSWFFALYLQPDSALYDSEKRVFMADAVRRGKWLSRFFADEPEWKERIVAWLTTVKNCD